MYSLKKYIDIVEGTTLLENPWEGKDPAKAATWAALSPEDQKFLGNADPTDQYILARAPNKGKPTQNVSAASQQGQQLAAQTAGMDDPASGVAGVQGGSQQDNMLAAQTAGMDEPAGQSATPAATPAAPKPPAAGASAEGDAGEAEAKAAMAAKAQSAGGDTGEVPGVTTQSGATAATAPTAPTAPTPPTAPTAPTPPTGGAAAPAAASAANRDAMPFGKAFADAKAKGEKQFTWKGKKYAVQTAAPKQSATPAKPLPGKAVPGASTSMMGDIDPATGMPSNPMPESVISENYVKELNAMRRIAGLNELDMNAMMKSLGDMPGATTKNTSSNTSNFKSTINGKQDDSEAGYNAAMGKFNDIAKGMNLPGGAKFDPSNIQGSIDGIQKGIMGKFGDMSKRVGSSAPGANIPNPPSATQKQDPKDILKGMQDTEIENLSGDDAKELLGQLKKLSGL